MNFGLFTYSAAALSYAVLAMLLVTSWKSSRQARLLLMVALMSLIWSVSAVYLSLNGEYGNVLYLTSETLRYTFWFFFLLKMFDVQDEVGNRSTTLIRWSLPGSILFTFLVTYIEVVQPSASPTVGFVGHVLLAIIGLAIIEQIYRNTSSKHRWALKYLVMGAGSVFAFDLFMYSHALLFSAIDIQLWGSRGIVQLIIVPLLAIAAARNKSWDTKIFVSRDIVLNTSAIIGGGVYLLIMSMVGYYLREMGGTWGYLTQTFFFTLSIVLLISIFLSEQIRARARVFFGKHFYKNKYDYREEWLQLTNELTKQLNAASRFSTVIQVLARIVDCKSGLVWIKNDKEHFQNVGAWQMKMVGNDLYQDDSLIQFLSARRYIVNLYELEKKQQEYAGLSLPEWFNDVEEAWLVIPLFDGDELFGLVILARPLVVRAINWEDRDLLKIASNQVANFLLILQQSEALSQAKQFEVFNRLSAFMVHDLKNIAAEMELVAKNSEKFCDNPEFIEDAFETVHNASGEIMRLVELFKSRRLKSEKKTIIELNELVQEVVLLKSQKQPIPEIRLNSQSSYVAAEKKRLLNVIAHIIDNAQEATDQDGEIRVTIESNVGMNKVIIADTGHGMDKSFIEQRLFKPFDTTKGNAGMGIGMCESRDYIREIGGEIEVSSEPQKGTTMIINLPMASAATLA